MVIDFFHAVVYLDCTWPSCSVPVRAAESFATTDQQYLAADGNQNKDDGCTAVAAVLIGSRLVVANVGDSRAVLSRNSQGAQGFESTCGYAPALNQ